MAYCKLYTNFASKINNLKFRNMKQRNLISIDDADLIYMNWFLEYLLTKNKQTYLFSRTEESIIKRWQQQIKKAI